MRKNKNLP